MAGSSLTTFELECASCGELRWPVLPERPATYTCARCRMVVPEKRAARVEAGRKRAETMAQRKASKGKEAPSAA